MSDIERLRAENIDDRMKNGPGLRKGTNTWIEARDPENGLVLLGGLGAMGVGSMWVGEEPYHREKAGYDDAPIAHGELFKLDLRP